MLSGYAGTGKTFLSMRFLAQVEATGLIAELQALGRAAIAYLQPSDDPADPMARTLMRLVEGQAALFGQAPAGRVDDVVG